jgi:type I restriction enzyme S subunit
MSKISKTTLGSLIEFQRGYDLPKSEMVEGIYPVRSSNGVLGYHNEYKTEGPGITIGRSGTVGIPHLIKTNFYPHNTSLFIKDFKGNSVNYIFYLLKNLKLGNRGSGSGVPTMNRNHLHPLDILAHLDNSTQKQIAKVLSDLDTKIELNNKINTNLEAMSKLIYNYWFVQFDFPDKNGKPYKSSGGKMVYNEELKREVPKGWEVKELGEEIEIERGISYKSSEIKGSGIPMINLNSFNLDGTYKKSGIKMYSGKYKNSKLGKAGDLLIAVTDVTRNAEIIGKAILVPEYYSELVYSMDITKVVPSDSLSSSYLMMLFNTDHYHNYIKWYASGTIVLHLNMDGMKWYKAEIPPKYLLDKFDALYKPLAKQISETTKQNQKLAEIRDWLLPMLMNGQVKVG